MTEREQLEQRFVGMCYDASDHESDVKQLTEEIEDTGRFRGLDTIAVYKQLQDLAHKLIYACQHGIMLEERVALCSGHLQLLHEEEQNNASPV